MSKIIQPILFIGPGRNAVISAALPYILYAAVLTYVVYRVAKHELSHEPIPHVQSDLVEYDEATGRFYDQLTHEEVDPSEVMGVQ